MTFYRDRDIVKVPPKSIGLLDWMVWSLVSRPVHVSVPGRYTTLPWHWDMNKSTSHK